MRTKPAVVALTAIAALALVGLADMSLCRAADTGNTGASTEQFRDMGFGLFIHWGPVAQMGKEISWPVVDASQDFREKYFNLYKTFNPTEFNPDRWARLARNAGMKYVVFTTKHHDGFCMYDSAYTDYDITNTPYARDITVQVAEAFRAEDIAIGWYYSPADWHYLYVHGHESGYDYSMKPGDYDAPYGTKDLPLLEYEKRQVEELLTRYGHVDIMWYDGPGKALADHTWKLRPDVFVARARGAGIPTPEQQVPEPGEAPEGAWETCMTMGDQWAYRPNDSYKSARQLIHTLVKIRAMGGNFLLNVGPKPDGTLPEPQVKLLEEMSTWMDVNAGAIHGVRPWKKPRENDTWFTAADGGQTVYAILTRWPDDGEVTLEALGDEQVKNIRLCGAPGALEWNAAEDSIRVTLPPEKPCKYSYALEIQLKD